MARISKSCEVSRQLINEIKVIRNKLDNKELTIKEADNILRAIRDITLVVATKNYADVQEALAMICCFKHHFTMWKIVDHPQHWLVR